MVHLSVLLTALAFKDKTGCSQGSKVVWPIPRGKVEQDCILSLPRLLFPALKESSLDMKGMHWNIKEVKNGS